MKISCGDKALMWGTILCELSRYMRIGRFILVFFRKFTELTSLVRIDVFLKYWAVQKKTGHFRKI